MHVVQSGAPTSHCAQGRPTNQSQGRGFARAHDRVRTPVLKTGGIRTHHSDFTVPKLEISLEIPQRNLQNFILRIIAKISISSVQYQKRLKVMAMSRKRVRL